jgi:PAS domain S-box-containing protein
MVQKDYNTYQANKEAPDSLQESKEKFHLLVESVRDYAILMTDLEGYIISWNKGAEKIKGYTSNEVLGKHISIFYTNEEIENGHPENNLKMAAEQGRFEIEGWRIRKDGSLFWADVVFTALFNQQGALTGFAKVTRDITKQKKIEDELAHLNETLEKRVAERTEELQISEKKFHDLFQNNPMPMWVIDSASLQILDVNKAATRHYGYSRKEFLSMTSVDIRPKDEKDRYLQLNRTSKPNSYYAGFWKHLKKDGTIITVEVNADDILFEGKPARIILSNDVTEKIKIEESLRKTLKEVSDYKYALDESSIIAITDQKGTIKHVNNNFCKISKYSAEELIGQDHRIINSGFHPKEYIKDLWVTIAHGKIWRGELKNKAKDESIYWVDTTIVPFLNENGKPYQYVAIRSDITERKEAEEKLLLLNAELEDRVEQRTHQLEMVNKELEAFSYSVSHDLRSPLRAVNGYAKILEEDYFKVLDEEGQRLLKTVQYNAKKMGVLIDDLLSFSRLGRKDVKKSLVNMTELTRKVIFDLQRDLSHKAKIILRELHPALADHSLITQVMTNLISNAIKYSSKKEKPEIKISSEKKGNDIVYTVSDNGTGFDMQYAHKLFGVFQRLHSDDFEGTGVGLAIVHRIIVRHGGSIWAESKIEKGATFYFSLPDH